ncbi:MAG: hypothetical protein ACRECW_10025 [Phyllobacterium sp.]
MRFGTCFDLLHDPYAECLANKSSIVALLDSVCTGILMAVSGDAFEQDQFCLFRRKERGGEVCYKKNLDVRSVGMNYGNDEQGSTLLPMLIGGLIMVVVGAIVIMMFV